MVPLYPTKNTRMTGRLFLVSPQRVRRISYEFFVLGDHHGVHPEATSVALTFPPCS